MNSQTARRPDKKQPTRSTHSKRYKKQTALHVETRRDGQALIGKWGGHLSRSEKTAIQRLSIWGAIVLIVVLIIAVFVGFWVNFNIIVPNQPITTFLGQSIPQSDYHKMVALDGQLEENHLKGVHGLYAQRDSLKIQASNQLKVKHDADKKVADLNKQIAALPAGSSDQRTNLENQLKTAQDKQKQADNKYNQLSNDALAFNKTSIPNEEVRFTQSQVGNDSAQWLQDDILIRNWLNSQSAAIQNQVNPTDAQINRGIADFKANLPKSKTYDQFLSTYNVSDGDIHTMMAVKVRRDNLQHYAADQITSPTRQVQVRDIVLSTKNDANDTLKKLQGGADFAQLAKEKSVDNNSKSKGGELGWFAQGQYAAGPGSSLSAVIDNWLFNKTHTKGEYSPVLTENGTYHILQIEDIDNARPLDDATLKSLKANALSRWILSQQAIHNTKYGTLDNDKMFDPMNMPAAIPSAAPSQQGNPGGVPGAPGAPGLPGAPGAPGAPGGVPAQ